MCSEVLNTLIVGVTNNEIAQVCTEFIVMG